MSTDWPAMVVAKVVMDRVGETPEQISAATHRFVESFESRVGPADWEVVGSQPWAGAPAELTEIVRQQASTGVADGGDGYAFTLYARREPVGLSVGVDVGGPTLGRRLPRQNVTGTLKRLFTEESG